MDKQEIERLSKVIEDQYRKLRDPSLSDEQRTVLYNWINELETKLIRGMAGVDYE